MRRAFFCAAFVLLTLPAAAAPFAQEDSTTLPEIYSRRPVKEFLPNETWRKHACSAYQVGVFREANLVVADRVVAAQTAISAFADLDWSGSEAQHQVILDNAAHFLTLLRTATEADPTGTDSPAFLLAVAEQKILAGYFKPQESDDDFPVDVYFDFAAEVNPGKGTFRPYDWDDDDNPILHVPPQQMADFRILADTLTRIVSGSLVKVMMQFQEQLGNEVERWDNYLQHGYSQLPWETWINGWLLDESKFGPPERQWIAVHPGIAVEIGPANSDLRATEALSIEMLGHLWYTGESLESYWGASLVTNLRDDMDPGYGVLLHLGGSFNFGALWRSEFDDPFFFVSLDAYGMVDPRRRDGR